jgi:gluconokinase
MNPLFLAIDIGTSSSRTALFDDSGKRIAPSTAQATYPLHTDSDGAATMRPLDLLRAVKQCLAKSLNHRKSNKLLRDRPIRAIGVSCFWHSLIGTDTKGSPLTDVITWADSRCRPDAAHLREELDERRVHSKTGCMLRASFWPAKLHWLRRTSSSTFHRVKRWMSPAEWVQAQLADGTNCAFGMATGTGLFNPSTLQWDPELLEVLRISESQLQPLGDTHSQPSSHTVKEFPELKGAAWFPSIGDGAASNLGSGCTEPGLAAINVGTSAALRVMMKGRKAKAPFGLFCYRVDADRFLVGGAVSNAGNLRAWCLENLRTASEADLEKLLANRPGPNHGLTVLPFWTAERAPKWNEDSKGTILGISQATTGLDLFQAITESTYHRISRIEEILRQKHGPVSKYLVSGGIQRSNAALQRLANVMNVPLYPNPEPEASIRGAAVFAMEKLGFKPSDLERTSPLRPQKKFVEQYAEERRRQLALESLLERARL